ncbi:hypothetical protein XELAEV_18002639mg [Xenopus laevis]|uniref:Uncharacterized protein n=1 Tax=Xenopus laevis TaxID=8355 RepID=A0A974GZ18_XENLA|nr:hypothetical protein XELAEV_18002639mg [Xenopus laevis]
MLRYQFQSRANPARRPRQPGGPRGRLRVRSNVHARKCASVRMRRSAFSRKLPVPAEERRDRTRGRRQSRHVPTLLVPALISSLDLEHDTTPW